MAAELPVFRSALNSDVRPWPWKYEALALALHAKALLTMYCRSNYLHACRMMHLIVSIKYR